MIVALLLLLIVPELTVKVADVDVAATVTDAGTVSVELLLDRLTAAPPAGAGWVKVTVHVLEALELRLLGLQDTAETDTVATRFTVVLAELLL